MRSEKKITYNYFENVSEIFDALDKIQNETQKEVIRKQMIQFKHLLADIYTPGLNFEGITNLVEEIVYNSSMEQVTVKCSYYNEDDMGENILEILLQDDDIPYIVTETSTCIVGDGTKKGYDTVKKILSKYFVNPADSADFTNNESNQADGTMFVSEEQIETVVKRIIKSMMD